jgi:hypothetical protein
MALERLREVVGKTAVNDLNQVCLRPVRKPKTLAATFISPISFPCIAGQASRFIMQ